MNSGLSKTQRVPVGISVDLRVEYGTPSSDQTNPVGVQSTAKTW